MCEMQFMSISSFISKSLENSNFYFCHLYYLRSLFTKPMNLLPQDLVKSRSHEVGCYNDPIALIFDKHFGSTDAEMHNKLQSTEHLEKCKPESRGYETSRDLAVRRPPA